MKRALVFAIIAAGCSAAPDEGPTVADVLATSTTAAATTTTAAVPTTTPPEPAATTSGAEPAPDLGLLDLGPGTSFVVLDDPAMVPASEASWLQPDDVVLGLARGDEAHAFPVSQMSYHHIANTNIAGEPYLVTY